MQCENSSSRGHEEKVTLVYFKHAVCFPHLLGLKRAGALMSHSSVFSPLSNTHFSLQLY